METELPGITEKRRLQAPAPTPQALACTAGSVWLGTRDGRRIYRMDPTTWQVAEEHDSPGIPWAAVSTGQDLQFTLGIGEDDDRYIRTYLPGSGFTDAPSIACPDFTGSYLSFDGEHLCLSQWYKHRILKLDANGNIIRATDVGAEICGHTFVDGLLYLLRGTEEGDETWHIARLDPDEEAPLVEDIARVPFQCRSLAFDGEQFWTNHRAGGMTIAFALPQR
jgi:hypothetical protein